MTSFLILTGLPHKYWRNGFALIFQVHIRISSYQCGGVLLNHWYVATAAHCVHQAKLSQITVHLGEYDTKDTENVSWRYETTNPNL